MFLPLLILLILSTIFFGLVLVTDINSRGRLGAFIVSALLLVALVFSRI